MGVPRLVFYGAAVAFLALLGLGAPQATAVVDTTVTPLQWAQAMEASPGLVTGVTVIQQGMDSTPFGVANAPMTFFPSAGNSFSVLVAGDASTADAPNGWIPGQSCGNDCQTNSNGNSYNGGNDVTILKVDIDVPAFSPLCQAPVPTIYIDYQFLSEEWDFYLGQSFNDAFLAELDVTTWSIAGAVLTAPDNFAVDTGGGPLSVNSATMTNANAITSAFNGGTAMFNAIKPTTAGPHSIYFSIFDATDSAMDSGAFIDNLRVCAPPPDPPLPPVADFTWLFTTTSPNNYDLDPVQFTDTSFFQYPGSPRTWSWTLGDGATSTAQHPVNSYADDGTYTACLTITESSTDWQGNPFVGTDTTCHDILVNNRPPVGTLGMGSMQNGTIALQCTGTDYDGTVVSCFWIFGDGQTSTAQNPTHSYDRNGRFRICLIVSDDDGATDQHCETVHVYDPPQPANDTDLDGIADPSDNCPGVPNEDQADSDMDGTGDACEPADEDPGPSPAPPTQSPSAARPPDTDKDGIADDADNCPLVANQGQEDRDGDQIGDLCDDDLDGDGVANLVDVCPLDPDPGQADSDADGRGDACDTALGACAAACADAALAAPVVQEPGEAQKAGNPAATTSGMGFAALAMTVVLAAVLVVAVLLRRKQG